MENGRISEPFNVKSAVASLAGDYRLHEMEFERLAALEELEAFARPDDPPLNSLARQAAGLCGSQMGLVSFIEADSQRVVGSHGLHFDRVARCDTICASTILQFDPMVVEDAKVDGRFAELPGVMGEPNVRFYAGVPILTDGGMPIGAICAIDAHPHEVSSHALFALQRLANLVTAVLQTRKLFAEARGTGREFETIASQSHLDALLLTFVEPRTSRR